MKASADALAIFVLFNMLRANSTNLAQRRVSLQKNSSSVGCKDYILAAGASNDTAIRNAENTFLYQLVSCNLGPICGLRVITFMDFVFDSNA